MKTITMAICLDCGELEEFIPDEFGLNYYQAIGECQYCHKPTYYRNGERTKEIIKITINSHKEVSPMKQ